VVECGCVGDTSELELTRPDMRRWIIDEATCEVTLHTADEVVVLRMRAF
jgi:hypothetical protein